MATRAEGRGRFLALTAGGLSARRWATTITSRQGRRQRSTAAGTTAVGFDPSQDVVNRCSLRAIPRASVSTVMATITRIHAGLATAKQMDQFVSEALSISRAGRQRISP